MISSRSPRAEYFYFEVIRGSGEVEITVDLKAPHGFTDSGTSTFYVEEGQYRVAVGIDGVHGGMTVHDQSRFDAEFVIHSPSASASLTRRTIVWGRFNKESLSLGAMTVEPWEPPPPAAPAPTTGSWPLELALVEERTMGDVVRFPAGIAVSPQGDVYLAYGTMYGDHGILAYAGSQDEAWWGLERRPPGYGSGDGEFHDLSAIAIDREGRIYVTEVGNNRVQVFTSSGEFLHKWGTAGSGDGAFDVPRGIAVDREGRVYVTEVGNNRVQVFTSRGEFLHKWGTPGDGDGAFDGPLGVAVDGDSRVYVVDAGNDRIQVFSSSGEFLHKWGTSGDGDGAFDGPLGVAVDGENRIYVTDTGNNRIQVFSSAGELPSMRYNWTMERHGAYAHPRAIAVGGQDGDVYLVERRDERLIHWKMMVFRVETP